MSEARCLLEELDRPVAHVIVVSGDIDVATAPGIRTAIAHARHAGCERLVIDLSAATYIDSAGLSTLFGAWRRTREGGRLAIVCAPGPVLHAIREVGMEGVVPLFVSREAALEQYARETAPAVTV
jgi:anti-sigma B factor antagonist